MPSIQEAQLPEPQKHVLQRPSQGEEHCQRTLRRRRGDREIPCWLQRRRRSSGLELSTRRRKPGFTTRPLPQDSGPGFWPWVLTCPTAGGGRLLPWAQPRPGIQPERGSLNRAYPKQGEREAFDFVTLRGFWDAGSHWPFL